MYIQAAMTFHIGLTRSGAIITVCELFKNHMNSKFIHQLRKSAIQSKLECFCDELLTKSGRFDRR